MKKTTSIMMTAVTTAFIFSAVILGCSKDSGSNSSGGSTYVDPCSGVTCLNGGTCSGGVCTCPTGYTGTRCETKVVADKGTIQFINNSTNPYDVYIDGSWKVALEGKHSITLSVEVGTHTCRVIQKSGYISYPTDESVDVTVTKNNNQIVTFP